MLQSNCRLTSRYLSCRHLWLCCCHVNSPQFYALEREGKQYTAWTVFSNASMRLHICHKHLLSIVFATAAFFTFQWLWLPLTPERREEGTKHSSGLTLQTWFTAHAKVSLDIWNCPLYWVKDCQLRIADLHLRSIIVFCYGKFCG